MTPLAIDYVTGVMCAIVDKKLSSAVGFKGIFKKILIFVLVGVGHILDTMVIGTGSVLRTAVIFFYLSNEGISLIENAGYIVGYLGGRCVGEIFPLCCGNSADLKQLIPGPQGQRVYDVSGVACTQTAGAGGWGGKTGLYFIDLNSDPKITDVARCVTARQDSGVSKHRGEHSGVLVEEGPRAILRPDREKTRQNGRRMKEPEEPMFTLTAQDRHGIYHRGRIRKLTPRECWRLQGFTDEQFNKAAACIHADGHLYKMAGNSVSVPVISAIGRKIRYVNEKYHIMEEMHE